MFDVTPARLRALPSLSGRSPVLELTSLPGEPVETFSQWLDEALQAGVPEPHALTLATVDATGIPDARTLILKAVDNRGWAFASQLSSTKGIQLQAQPSAAMNFWWQPIARAVRLRGLVQEASREDSEADFAARSTAARSGVDSSDWTLWRLQPQQVEFWQAAADRRHVRITYRRTAEGWEVLATDGESSKPRGSQQ